MTIGSFLKTTGLVVGFVLPWLFASAIQNHPALAGTWVSKNIEVIPLITTAVFGIAFSLWANNRLREMGVLRKRRVLFIGNILGTFVGLAVYAFLASVSVDSQSRSTNVLRSVVVGFTVLCCVLLIKSGLYALASRNKNAR
jgi:hypothetical protein